MRIYVASLSDYNDGRLEGKWFDLADYSDASELMEAIQEMLDDLTKKYNDGEVREEWAVHDYEGIPSTLASEYMGEQDFQQLYDIAEVADDRGIPVEVLVERAGDTGSDDYQALADSLMFVVDGNDESDIVYEYEEQLGGLGNDFWSNHIYIDDVTERVMYGEDVDRFREDILYENPDMDEDEAERQAEEMADEEAERREDLTTYLEDMGYVDEIPSFVSKDYEGAWKRSLSYDLDVIHHDGQMYVFSNSYSVGGTILSGMIGAYIGYQVGKQGLNRVAYKTGEKLGKATRRVKTSVKRVKKKFATGGRVEYVDTKRTDKNYFFLRFDGAIGSFAWIYNGKYNEGILYPLDDFDKEYYAHIKLKSGEKLYRYATERMSNSDKYAIKPFGENRYLIKLNLDKGLIYFMSEENDPNDDKNVRFDSRGTKADYIVIDKEKYAKGGGVDNVFWEKGFVEPDEDSDDRRYAKYETEIGNLQIFISEWSHRNWNILIQDKRDYKYLKSETFEGDLEGAKHYAISLAKELKSKGFATGGGIGFKALSAKVAKRYEGKKPEAKYRAEYGKRYSKSEAKEVGDKVAGKVYWQQQGRKMETGGGVDYPNHYLEVEDLNQKINALTQQIEADYRNNEIDNYTDRNERELVRLKERLDWLMWGKDSYSQGGGISGLNDLIRG